MGSEMCIRDSSSPVRPAQRQPILEFPDPEVRMRSIKTLLGSSLLALSLVATHVPAAEKTAPIHFGDITWESGSLITEILRLIVEKGYGYPTDTLPGSTVSLEAALARNDIQVIGEEWAGRRPAWVKAASEGKVFGLGDTVKGATEGLSLIHI